MFLFSYLSQGRITELTSDLNGGQFKILTRQVLINNILTIVVVVGTCMCISLFFHHRKEIHQFLLHHTIYIDHVLGLWGTTTYCQFLFASDVEQTGKLRLYPGVMRERESTCPQYFILFLTQVSKFRFINFGRWGPPS